jgi:hypothetical protein
MMTRLAIDNYEWPTNNWVMNLKSDDDQKGEKYSNVDEFLMIKMISNLFSHFTLEMTGQLAPT